MLNKLVPHLNQKDILFNAISEAIACVQNAPFPGRAKHLNKGIEPNGALCLRERGKCGLSRRG
jgi:hypothetical protein